MMARRLPTKMVEKVWGRDLLPAPFVAPPGERIGEIWFQPPPQVPQVLVKYLFTSEKLSVQVHPSDATAIAGEAGKEECWLVLDAEPDACLAIGFTREVTPEEIAAAAQDGTIEDLLVWHPAQPGDLFYLPAGTVHAIGPGLSLVEVQQTSETTFRLYDYGRPRELHLDAGLAVAKGSVHADARDGRLPERGGAVLVDGPLFGVAWCDGQLPPGLPGAVSGPWQVAAIDGQLTVAGEMLQPGECALVSTPDDIRIPAGTRAVLAWVPAP